MEAALDEELRSLPIGHRQSPLGPKKKKPQKTTNDLAQTISIPRPQGYEPPSALKCLAGTLTFNARLQTRKVHRDDRLCSGSGSHRIGIQLFGGAQEVTWTHIVAQEPPFVLRGKQRWGEQQMGGEGGVSVRSRAAPHRSSSSQNGKRVEAIKGDHRHLRARTDGSVSHAADIEDREPRRCVNLVGNTEAVDEDGRCIPQGPPAGRTGSRDLKSETRVQQLGGRPGPPARPLPKFQSLPPRKYHRILRSDGLRSSKFTLPGRCLVLPGIVRRLKEIVAQISPQGPLQSLRVWPGSGTSPSKVTVDCQDTNWNGHKVLRDPKGGRRQVSNGEKHSRLALVGLGLKGTSDKTET
ncbi:hypothetical protein BDK51DRAFT_32226 [Blyttiomyces helicus]|uniref:Uncharacterized protein n=1 Tax=Blyttiomyces helicus TaxID=388810 RepID=A0A4V1IQ84_9FUNG|nr:hypothetical protein BDK51DRAFT_32226 [Blyttiomyces helicus]|eukprot:RKO85667.1 hypothetical protein BDK51DRAFT_32226 [Blyttiomyces helicus]